jgi:hypothetical protein
MTNYTWLARSFASRQSGRVRNALRGPFIFKLHAESRSLWIDSAGHRGVMRAEYNTKAAARVCGGPDVDGQWPDYLSMEGAWLELVRQRWVTSFEAL